MAKAGTPEEQKEQRSKGIQLLPVKKETGALLMIQVLWLTDLQSRLWSEVQISRCCSSKKTPWYFSHILWFWCLQVLRICPLMWRSCPRVHSKCQSSWHHLMVRGWIPPPSLITPAAVMIYKQDLLPLQTGHGFLSQCIIDYFLWCCLLLHCDSAKIYSQLNEEFHDLKNKLTIFDTYIWPMIKGVITNLLLITESLRPVLNEVLLLWKLTYLWQCQKPQSDSCQHQQTLFFFQSALGMWFTFLSFLNYTEVTTSCIWSSSLHNTGEHIYCTSCF